ncbi:rhodanese-like domain-containing protein [Bacteroidia bacterium]|nr:rhodanese-like domain-containing protein [Bacteroidia bacterium]
MKDITVEELKQKIDNKEDFLLIDVREEWEYSEFNINGKLIPLGTLQGAIDDIDDEWMDKEVVVHCKAGARSAAAKAFMVQQGFKNVRNLLGGMIDWQAKFS